MNSTQEQMSVSNEIVYMFLSNQALFATAFLEIATPVFGIPLTGRSGGDRFPSWKLRPRTKQSQATILLAPSPNSFSSTELNGRLVTEVSKGYSTCAVEVGPFANLL